MTFDYVQSPVEVVEVHILQKDVKDVSEDPKKHIFKGYLLFLISYWQSQIKSGQKPWLQLVRHQFSIPSNDLNGLVAWQDVTFDPLGKKFGVIVEISLGLGRSELWVGMGLWGNLGSVWVPFL